MELKNTVEDIKHLKIQHLFVNPKNTAAITCNKKIQIFEIQNQKKNTTLIPVCMCIYIYICQVHPLGPFHLFLLTLLALLCRLLAACLWLSVLQYWLQFISNCTYQLLLGNFDCKSLKIVCVWLVIYWDIVRIITNTNFQSSLTTYFT